MNFWKRTRVNLPELALVAITRATLGFGAGLLIADKFKTERRKTLGWWLLVGGAASTLPIAMHVFGKRD